MKKLLIAATLSIAAATVIKRVKGKSKAVQTDRDFIERINSRSAFLKGL